MVPKGDVIYNPGDDISAIMIVLEGEIKVTMQLNATDEVYLETLSRRSSYGKHTVLQILKQEEKEKEYPRCKHKLEALEESLVIWIDYEVLET